VYEIAVYSFDWLSTQCTLDKRQLYSELCDNSHTSVFKIMKKAKSANGSVLRAMALVCSLNVSLIAAACLYQNKIGNGNVPDLSSRHTWGISFMLWLLYPWYPMDRKIGVPELL
jgi:hypothetical protein